MANKVLKKLYYLFFHLINLLKILVLESDM